MSSEKVLWDASDSSDNDTVSLTSTKVSPERECYPLEGVLAERTTDGVTEYLVKWKGYPEYECTWEVKEHFDTEQTLIDWGDQKMRITRGLAQPFDLDSWERYKEEVLAATAKRRARRRAKKISLGLPVADEASLSQDLIDGGASDSDETSNSDDQDRPMSPAWTAKEESTLLEALQRFKAPRWPVILRFYGSRGIVNQNLKDRTEDSLQRKAVALKRDFDASGRDFPLPALPDDDRSISSSIAKNIATVPRRPSVHDRRIRDGSMYQPDEALQEMENAVMQTAKETPRYQRKPDRQIAQSSKKPDKLELNLPAHLKDVSGPRSAPAAAKGLAKTKLTISPTTVSSLIPSRPNITLTGTEPRPTQFGTVGRGPARASLLPMTKDSHQRINVLENWGAEPKKRRKSRYELITAQDAKAKPSGTFKKISTRRKYEVAGRQYERTPDINSLTFVNRKDGKALQKPPTPPKTAQQTPFQMLQRRMSEKQDEIPSVSDGTFTNEQTLTTGSKVSSSLIQDSGIDGESEAASAPAEANVPPRRASLPIETYIQRPSSTRAQSFAAPVAMMSSDRSQHKAQISDKHPVTPKPIVGSPEEMAATVNANKPAPNDYDGKSRNAVPAITQQAVSFIRSEHTKPHSRIDDISKLTDDDTSGPAPTTLQPKEDGYTLYPLDTLAPTRPAQPERHFTDVIAEILTGNEGHSTDTVIFRGLADASLKHLFLTIKVWPRQMHVWCKMMVTAGEYATFFHDPPGYLGSGWIVPFNQSIKDADNLSGMLAEHASGGLFFAKDFSLLIYPASCVGWDYLDKGFPKPPPDAADVKLRFAMFAPWPRIRQYVENTSPQTAEPALAVGREEVPVNAVLRGQFDLDFQRLVAQSNDKDGSRTRDTNKFFMVFPSAAQEEFDLVVQWLRANRPVEIYRQEDPGAWDYFCKSVELGVIICHAAFYDYWAMPTLNYLLRKSISMFNFSLEPMSPLGPDPHLIRLFPAGMAILLTDSLFLLRPTQAAQILAWFRLFALPTKPSGSWKICTRPAIGEWLLQLQEAFSYPHGKEYISCYGEILRLLPNDMTSEWDHKLPKDTAPVACMGHGVSGFDQQLGTNISKLADLKDKALYRNDVTLTSWFAGWAMMKQEKFRRFHVVTGRDENSEQHKQVKKSTAKYNHVAVTSFEKLAQTHAVWNWEKLKKVDEEKRAEARKRDEGAAADDAQESEQQQPVTEPVGREVERQDAPAVEDESLFLPMEIASSQ
ncbi:MAG: hypothetical protein Q9201_004322 [Fulgogasparrea decipioides]